MSPFLSPLSFVVACLSGRVNEVALCLTLRQIRGDKTQKFIEHRWYESRRLTSNPPRAYSSTHRIHALTA